MKPMTSLPMLLLAALAACTPVKPPEVVAPVKPIVVRVSSDPQKAELFFEGKPVGETPQSLRVAELDELLRLSASRGQEELVEKRIKFLSNDQVEVNFTFGSGRSVMAKVLGLPKILVFDYGSGVTFNVNRSDLKPEWLPLLERQSTMLNTHFPTLDVHVCGHTDSQGAKDFNLTLSLERARAVSSHLESRGVQKGRLKVQGFGSAYPVAANDNESGRAMNRRTEVILPQ
jgi:outer membrane protein OmpA-like peptidoglycan-associated protein